MKAGLARENTVLLSKKQESGGTPRGVAASDVAAWKAAMWFGIAVAVIGLGELALNFWPHAAFGVPEWEFGAMAQTLGGLPLPTIGLAAWLAGLYALGRRRGLIGMSVLLGLLGLAVIAALLLFWTIVPLALKGAPAMALDTIKQTAARSTLLGAGFGLLYLTAAVVTLRRVFRGGRDHA